MTNKGIITILVVVIAIGAVVYFVMPKKTEQLPPTGTTTEEVGTKSAEPINTVSASASNEEIIDYMVDTLGSEESTTAQASIDQTTAPSQEEIVSGINTNF